MAVTAPPRGPCLPPIRKTERARKANMPKVLIADELSERAKAIFDDRGIETDVKTGLSPDELVACIGDYDGLAVRSATKVTEKVLEAGPRLRVVGRAGIGLDNIHVPSAPAPGVGVMTTPFGNRTEERREGKEWGNTVK